MSNTETAIKEVINDLRPALLTLESLVGDRGHIKAMLAVLPFPAWVKDEDGRLIHVNAEYEKYYRAKRKDCIGQPASLKHKPHFADITATDMEALDSCDLIVFEDKTRSETRTIVKLAVRYRGEGLIFGVSLPHNTFHHSHNHLTLCA